MLLPPFTRNLLSMQSDWWLEEHGLIMEKPTFPRPAGKYMVTGDREVTTELTITEDNKWSLKQGAQLLPTTRCLPAPFDTVPQAHCTTSRISPAAPPGASSARTGNDSKCAPSTAQRYTPMAAAGVQPGTPANVKAGDAISATC